VTAVHVQTRGRPRHRDYGFLGAGPERPWWRAYAEHTAFERPTVLVESDGRGHRAYLSGIPSARRDAVGTVIRYTLVVEHNGIDGDGDSGGAAPDPTGVVALVHCWLADQDAGVVPGAGRLARALDAAFPEDEVERMLAAADAVPAADVRRRVAAAVRALPGPPGGPPPPERGPDWLGDPAAPAARAAFVQRVADLVVEGRPGRALLLNLVGSAVDLAPLLDDPRPLVVLAPDIAAAGPTRLDRGRGRVEAGKARSAAPPRTTPAPVRKAPARKAPPSRLRTVLTPLVLGLAAVIALLVPLLSR
jgi:hypothetical protein